MIKLNIIVFVFMDWFKIKSHIKNYNNDIYDNNNNCSYCNFEYTRI